MVSAFNLQKNLSKVKISIHFNELLINREYRDNITGMVRNRREFQPDILEVNEDAPTTDFGCKMENGDEAEVPPFQLSLNVHDMVVENVMLDPCASHNLMPKRLVENL